MMMEDIHHQVSFMISRGADYWKRADASLADHLHILDALEKRDGERAGDILAEHIRRGREALLREM
jgi:DNA-binding GntR family transcriptional regulator